MKNDETAFARFVRKGLGRSLYINYYDYAQYQHLARAKKVKKFHSYNISCITGKFLFIFSSNKPTLNLLTTSTNDW